ncbi:MAG: BamA/TamA family outer membrane protein, partial [Myxococcota bacterium]
DGSAAASTADAAATGARSAAPTGDAPQSLDITITVREGKRHELRLGGGLGFESLGGLIGDDIDDANSTRLEARGRAELTVLSFLDPLLTLRLSALPGFLLVATEDEDPSPVFEARGEFSRNDFLLPRLTLGGLAAYSVDSLDSYSTQGPRLGLQIDRQLAGEDSTGFGLLAPDSPKPGSPGNRILLSFGIYGQWVDIDPNDGISLDQLQSPSTLPIVYLLQSLTIDGRDDRLSPRTGFLFDQSLEQGLSLSGDRGLYFRSLTDVRIYLALGSRLSLAGRARGGFLITQDEQDSPITQRFYSGGSSSHRGFGLRRLAPFAITDDAASNAALGSGDLAPFGGDVLLETSLGLRMLVRKWAASSLGLALFVDAGDVVGSLGDLDSFVPHVAVGAGLRYNTSVLPIRFDLARRMNRLTSCQIGSCGDPDPDRRWVFHFSVGEAF